MKGVWVDVLSIWINLWIVLYFWHYLRKFVSPSLENVFVFSPLFSYECRRKTNAACPHLWIDLAVAGTHAHSQRRPLFVCLTYTDTKFLASKTGFPVVSLSRIISPFGVT